VIVDTIANAGLYEGLGARFARALSLLALEEFRGKKPGRYDVDGDSLFYVVQGYSTKARAEGVWESHRKYIDVQFVAQGIERIGWRPISALEVTQPYDPSKDAALYKGEGDFVTVPSGTFVALWPMDGHMPGVAVAAPVPVSKVVVKILV
jgi:YhcH/YjgK/YiaL family protein